MRNELPEGWTSAHLSEIGDWGSGGTPLRSRNEFYEGGRIPWLKIGDLNDGVVTSAEECITQAGLDCSAAKRLPKDALLIAMYGSIGKLGVTGIECTTNQAIAHCIPRINIWYLFWALRWNRETLTNLGKGGTQANISQSVLKDFEIPIAPMAEQKRIVQELEILLTRVNTAKDRLSRVPFILKRFRQAVLAAACSGKLTEEWRESMGNSLTSARPPPTIVSDDDQENTPDFSPSLPEKWCWVAVEDACESVIDYRGRTPPVTDSGIPHIRTTNIRGFKINWDTESFVTEETYGQYMTRGLPKKGDVLFTMEAPLGEAAVVDTGRKFSIAQRILLLRGKQTLFDGGFLALNLQASPVRAAIEARSTGTTVKGIAYKRLKYVKLPVPPKQEQEEIVRRVQSLFGLAEVIEKRVIAATVRAEKLPQAILSKAFRGELVPTEAALAKAEGRDFEPAETLLERIQRQREETASLAKGSARTQQLRGRQSARTD